MTLPKYGHLAIAAGSAGIVVALGALMMFTIASAAVGGPTVALTSTTATSTPTASSTIPITATFSEGVNGFGTSSVSVTNGTAANVSPSGTSTTFTFNVTATADGPVSVMIPADMVATTTGGLGNQQSNTLAFTVDTVAPVIAVTTALSGTTTTATPSFGFSSNEAGTINLGGGCTATTTAAIAGTTTLMFNALANGSYACTLTVMDSAGNVSNTLNINFTVAVVNPPVISNVAVTSTTTSSAMVTWTTDAAATSQVFYGTSASYGSSTPMDATLATSHSMMLSDLMEATLYHFQVQSTNAGGTATSSDQVFVTASTPATTPLAVTGVDNVDTTATADGTFASGWKWVLHFVVPSSEMFLKMKFSDFFTSTAPTSTFSTANNVRYYSPQASNATSSASAITVTAANTYAGAMNLTGDTSTTTPGLQVDVTVEAAVPSGTPAGVYSTNFGALSTTTP